MFSDGLIFLGKADDLAAGDDERSVADIDNDHVALFSEDFSCDERFALEFDRGGRDRQTGNQESQAQALF